MTRRKTLRWPDTTEIDTREHNPHHSPLPPTDMEPGLADALPRKTHPVQMDQRVCVRVHSKGRRLADTEGYCVKPVFDAFTKAGIWRDDSGRYIKEVSFSQEVSEVEETIIDIVSANAPADPQEHK